MHEIAIVEDILSQIEEHVRDNNASRVTRVILEVGKLSGIKPEAIAGVFDGLKQGTIVQDAEIAIESQNAWVRCLDCNKEGEIGGTTLECPRCGSLETALDHEAAAMKMMRVVRCGACGMLSFELSLNCPWCKSTNTRIVRGMDIVLKSLEMER
jgi:hydrogenase nickel incorporation protein HypA/HybF